MSYTSSAAYRSSSMAVGSRRHVGHTGTSALHGSSSAAATSSSGRAERPLYPAHGRTDLGTTGRGQSPAVTRSSALAGAATTGRLHVPERQFDEPTGMEHRSVTRDFSAASYLTRGRNTASRDPENDFHEEEAARKKAFEEAARKNAAEEAARTKAALKNAAEEEAARKKAAEEQAARKKAAEEEAALKKAAEEEAALKKAAEEEAARKEAAEEEEAALKKAAEEEAARKEARAFFDLVHGGQFAAVAPEFEDNPDGRMFFGYPAVGSGFDVFVRFQMRSSSRQRDTELCGGVMNVTRVVAVQSDLNGLRAFVELHLREADSRRESSRQRPKNPSGDDAQAALGNLKRCFADAPGGHARILFAWHGTDVKCVHDVCRHGPRNFRTTDAGYFGAGTYFALEAPYAARYSKRFDPNADGEYAVILFAVSVSVAMPITLDRDYRNPDADRNPRTAGFSKYFSDDPEHSIALAPKCDAPVKHYGKQHPKDPAVTLLRDVDFQACPEAEAQAHELVIHSHLRCTPIAIVYFKMDDGDAAAVP